MLNNTNHINGGEASRGPVRKWRNSSNIFYQYFYARYILGYDQKEKVILLWSERRNTARAQRYTLITPLLGARFRLRMFITHQYFYIYGIISHTNWLLVCLWIDLPLYATFLAGGDIQAEKWGTTHCLPIKMFNKLKTHWNKCVIICSPRRESFRDFWYLVPTGVLNSLEETKIM